MTDCTVTTQAELDRALADPSVDEINIESPRGVWIELRDDAGKYVRASDSASVSASGSASVRASGSASVRAFDSASVRASDSASVRAFDSASVRAGKYVSVHLHSQRVTLDGGVIIDMTEVDHHTIESWCEIQGLTVEGGTAIVYKAVDKDLRSGHGFSYPIGETVVDAFWKPSDECGAGLHFGPTPAHAEAYFGGDQPRFLACRIRLAEAVGITPTLGQTAKMKARSCDVLYEVDVHGGRI